MKFVAVEITDRCHDETGKGCYILPKKLPVRLTLKIIFLDGADATLNKDHDVPVEDIPFYEERLKGVLPNQDEHVWEKKVEIHTRFEQRRE